MNEFSMRVQCKGTIIDINRNDACSVALDEEMGLPDGYIWYIHSNWLERIGDDNIYKEYKFAGNVKVTIEECSGVWKLDFDPGDVIFKCNNPEAYGSVDQAEYFLGIPIVQLNCCGEWWINLTVLDGEHKPFVGECKEFPIYTNKEYCDKFVKAVELIVNKFVEIGYIEKVTPIVHNIGDMKVTFTPENCNSEYGTVEIIGMKCKHELPEEYLNGYPKCYKDLHSDDYILIDRNNVVHSGRIKGTRINKNMFSEIVEEFIACGMRLHDINNKKEEEIMFNGLDKNVESIVYDFDGCTVKVSKTDDEDKYEININPGNWKFDMSRNRAKYDIEISGASCCDWWINTNNYFNNGNKHFSNGDKFTIGDINIILKNVKGGVESRKTKHKEVKLMTREEMLKLLNKGEMLPSEICKKKYERLRECCIVNNICRIEEVRDKFDISVVSSSTCALCESYYVCNGCPLKMTRQSCKDVLSSYQRLCDYDDENHDEFIECIDNMISSLDKAIEYERDTKSREEVTHIGKMTLTAKKINGDLYKCSIVGMKHSEEINNYGNDGDIYCVAFGSGEFTIINYKGEHVTEGLTKKHFKFSSYSDNYTRGYAPLKCFKVTKAELKELKQILQECSDRLHKYNEPTRSICSKEKITIKVTEVENNMVTLDITGISPSPREFNIVNAGARVDYNERDNSIIITDENGNYIQPKGCNIPVIWIPIGNDNPMTKEAADEIIIGIAKVVKRVHKLNHPNEKSYTIVL